MPVIAAGSTEYATVGDKGRVTIPKSLRESLGIKEGDRIMFRVSASGIVEVVPMALVPKDQIWFYSEPMQERMARGEEDVRLGRTTRVSSRKHAQAHLDRLKRGE